MHLIPIEILIQTPAESAAPVVGNQSGAEFSDLLAMIEVGENPPAQTLVDGIEPETGEPAPPPEPAMPELRFQPTHPAQVSPPNHMTLPETPPQPPAATAQAEQSAQPAIDTTPRLPAAPVPAQGAPADPATSKPATVTTPEPLAKPDLTADPAPNLDIPPPQESAPRGRNVAQQPAIAATGTDPTLAQIRGQMTVVAIGREGGQTELRLDPPELGRVRISLEIVDGHVTAHLSPERPEVMELLRRHADLLARDFLDSGFSSAEMTFSEEQHNPHATPPGHAPPDDHIDTAEIHLTTASDRLDLRL